MSIKYIYVKDEYRKVITIGILYGLSVQLAIIIALHLAFVYQYVH